MDISCLIFTCGLGLCLSHAAAPLQADNSTVPIHPQAKVTFADQQAAQNILGKRDRFIKNLSAFDRQLRLHASQPVTEEQFLKFIQEQALDWSPVEQEKLTTVLNELYPLLRELKPAWPEQISLILTSGLEEAGAPHCREAAIVLPRTVLQRDSTTLKKLILHELFHVLSRHSSTLRRQLYEIVGFREVQPIELPTMLAGRKLTNPDAPLLNCIIQIEHEGRKLHVTPVLITKDAEYETFANRTLFGELMFRLMQVEEQQGSWRAKREDDRPILIEPRGQASYHQQIGRNTSYVIHPEEVLADNFIHMVLNSPTLPDPKIVEQMRDLMTAASDE